MRGVRKTYGYQESIGDLTHMSCVVVQREVYALCPQGFAFCLSFDRRFSVSLLGA